MFGGLSEQLHEFGQMCIEGCVELWWLSLGCVCVLCRQGWPLGLPLAVPSPGKLGMNLPSIPGTHWVTAQLGTLTSLHARAKGSTPLLESVIISAREGGRKGNLEPWSSCLLAAIYCLCFQNFVPDFIVVGNCLLVNLPQCECKCCSNSHVAYSWSCTNRWGSYIKSIFDNLMGFAKA